MLRCSPTGVFSTAHTGSFLQKQFDELHQLLVGLPVTWVPGPHSQSSDSRSHFHIIATMHIELEKLAVAVSQTVATTADRVAALQTIADLIRTSGNYRWAGLYDVDYARKTVANIVYSGPGAPIYPTFPITKGLTARAISHRRTVNVGDVDADPSYLTAFGTTKSEIIVPVFDRLNQTVVGTIDVESEMPSAFNEEVQTALENLAKEIHTLWHHPAHSASTPG